MQSLYSAGSGLSSQQARLETISSNISNVNTPGFKATRADFKDALYRSMVDPTSLTPEADNLQSGTGVLLESTAINMKQGTVSQTDEPLDFAIEGDGFFQVQDQNGQTLYTRSGSFTVSNEGGEGYLVTSEGYHVLDATGARVHLPANIADLAVDEKGAITAGGKTYGTLGLARFTNSDGLSPVGLTCYRATPASGAAAPDTGSKVVQGSIERSNVDLSEEMTLLIRAQRAYSLASRAVTTTDDMLGLANTMHG